MPNRKRQTEKGYVNYVRVQDVEENLMHNYVPHHKMWKWDSRYIFDGQRYYQKGRGKEKLIIFPYMDGDVVLYFEEAENDEKFCEKMNETLKKVSRGHLFLVPLDSQKTMDMLLRHRAYKIDERQVYQGTVANI
jgi:hypothetical protein